MDSSGDEWTLVDHPEQPPAPLGADAAKVDDEGHEEGVGWGGGPGDEGHEEGVGQGAYGSVEETHTSEDGNSPRAAQNMDSVGLDKLLGDNATPPRADDEDEGNSDSDDSLPLDVPEGYSVEEWTRIRRARLLAKRETREQNFLLINPGLVGEPLRYPNEAAWRGYSRAALAWIMLLALAAAAMNTLWFAATGKNSPPVQGVGNWIHGNFARGGPPAALLQRAPRQRRIIVAESPLVEAPAAPCQHGALQAEADKVFHEVKIVTVETLLPSITAGADNTTLSNPPLSPPSAQEARAAAASKRPFLEVVAALGSLQSAPAVSRDVQMMHDSAELHRRAIAASSSPVVWMGSEAARRAKALADAGLSDTVVERVASLSGFKSDQDRKRYAGRATALVLPSVVAATVGSQTNASLGTEPAPTVQAAQEPAGVASSSSPRRAGHIHLTVSALPTVVVTPVGFVEDVRAGVPRHYGRSPPPFAGLGAAIEVWTPAYPRDATLPCGEAGSAERITYPSDVLYDYRGVRIRPAVGAPMYDVLVTPRGLEKNSYIDGPPGLVRHAGAVKQSVMFSPDDPTRVHDHRGVQIREAPGMPMFDVLIVNGTLECNRYLHGSCCAAWETKHRDESGGAMQSARLGRQQSIASSSLGAAQRALPCPSPTPQLGPPEERLLLSPPLPRSSVSSRVPPHVPSPQMPSSDKEARSTALVEVPVFHPTSSLGVTFASTVGAGVVNVPVFSDAASRNTTRT